MTKLFIEDTTLTAIGDAIREKTGGTDLISPSNMPSEISSIETGGDTTQEDGIVDGSLTEYANDRVTQVNDYVFYHKSSLTTVDLPKVTYVGEYGFDNCSKLENVNIPEVTTLKKSSFNQCTKLATVNFPLLKHAYSNAFSSTSIATVNFPLLTYADDYCFSYCQKLANVNLPLLGSVHERTFQNCTALASIDLPSITTIEKYGFYLSSALEKLILRSETMVTLSATSALVGTPITSGTGYIYVPDDLVESYKSATNWSKYADQIKPISELEASA